MKNEGLEIKNDELNMDIKGTNIKNDGMQLNYEGIKMKVVVTRMSNEGKRWKSRRRIRCEDKVLGNANEEYAWDGEEDWIMGQEKD